MTELDCRSLEEAMMACFTRYDYKVCIVIPSFRRMYDFAAAMRNQFKDGSVPAAHYERGIDKLSFDNGSSIQMIDCSNDWNLIGISVDRVLYDPDIKDKETLKLIQICERKPSFDFMDKKNIRSAKEIEVDPQPLDEFLSEFSITKV